MEKDWNKYFFNLVKDYVNESLDWYGLSENPNITWEIVEANPDIPWDWYGLSRNPNITMDIVEANPDKSWDWNWLNIYQSIKNANPDKSWNECMFARNQFTTEKEMFELRVKHQNFVQEHLLEEFVKAYMHPNRIMKLLNMGYSIDELDEIL